MKVTNSTSDALGFAQYVIGPGESLDVNDAAADWYCRHGCTSDSSKPASAPAPADAITEETTPRRSKRRSRRD